MKCNKTFHLEDWMVLHGIYNSDTLENLIDTVYTLHNQSTWNEKLFVGEIEKWYRWYLSAKGVNHCAINSLLFLTTAREKYVKIYERFINQLKMYFQVICVLSKGYLPISLLPPLKLNTILQEVKEALQVNNRDYDLVIKKVIPLLWYEIGNIWHWWSKKFNNSIPSICSTIQYTQWHLKLYQVETVSVPIIDENKQVQSYTCLRVKKPYIALNSEAYISLRTQELDTCKKIGYEFYLEELFVLNHKTKYSHENAIYFDLGTEIIKENCDF